MKNNVLPSGASKLHIDNTRTRRQSSRCGHARAVATTEESGRSIKAEDILTKPNNEQAEGVHGEDNGTDKYTLFV